MSWRYKLAPLYRLVYRTIAPRAGGFRIAILHDVSEEQRKSLVQFIEYAEKQHGIITPADAERIIDGDQPSSNGRTPWLLSFDDGFESNYHVARDVLTARGIRGLFFICPGILDAPLTDHPRLINDNVFDGGAWRPAVLPRMMTWQQARALTEAGHTLGSHSLLHRRLTALAGEELHRDIELSAERIASETGIAPRWFAYPFGDVESISPAALAAIAARYRYCCSGVRGVNTAQTNRAAILREGLDLSATHEYLKLVADGGLDPVYLSARRKLKLFMMAAAVHTSEVS
jgi:peptidoglycan/xylan/chitin deacetylase (PgdA/CDA1 family)